MSISHNYLDVSGRVHASALRVGRDPADITLVGVSKTHSFDHICEAYAAGLRHFGENRVEEGKPKVELADKAGLTDMTWHMIGHIQSRKSADVAGVFKWVHSVDRLKVARKLGASAAEKGEQLQAFIEVNLSGEASKYGYDLSEWPRRDEPFTAFCHEINALLDVPGIAWQGLMTMAPYSANPEDARPVYSRARSLRDALDTRFGEALGGQLSMGMSGDFETAVEEGATFLRIGTAIFGVRG